MSRVVGDGQEIINFSKSIRSNLKDMIELNRWATLQLQTLRESAKDSSYNEAEITVTEVGQQILSCLENCYEVTMKLNEYGEFLKNIE